MVLITSEDMVGDARHRFELLVANLYGINL
jgi:hypothetical protein